MILYKEEYNVGQEKRKRCHRPDAGSNHGMTAEELAGENGLLKKLTSRFYSKVLDAEMDKHLGYKKMIIPAAIVVTVETVTQKKLL